MSASASAHATAPPAEAPAKRGPGIMTLVKALAFVSVIVLIEVAAATAFLPSAEETRETGKRLVAAAQGADAEVAAAATEAAEAAGHDEHATATSEHAEYANQPTVELSLGPYHVIAFNPSTGASMSIDFELFGVVLAADEPEFAERFGLHAKRLNEQVTIAIRGMESADFTDPGLGLIKRVVLEKVNRALGKPLVREAVFSEFAFIER